MSRSSPLSRRFRRRWLVLGLALLPVVAVVGLACVNLARLGGWRFLGGLDAVLERSEQLALRARTFEQEAALRDLAPNPLNGFVYRFDERAAEAQASEPEGEAPARAPRPRLLSLEFEGADGVELVAPDGALSMADGCLRLGEHAGALLTTRGEFTLDPAEVGEVHLRMRLAKGHQVVLGWGDGQRDLGHLTLHAFPGPEFRTYAIDAASLLRNTLSDEARSLAPIRKLTLRASNAPADEVEIDFLRFVSRREKFAAASHGRTYETFAEEMRACLYVSTPLRLRYTLELPPGQRTFRCGLAVLDPTDPVDFRLLAGSGAAQQELGSQRVERAGEWHAWTLDLSALPAGSIELTLETTSAGGNIAFWSNPRLHGARARPFHILLLLEDTLRADRLSLYGHERPTSPFKEELFAGGVVFERAYSQETKTRPSCPSLMTSLLPSATGVWSFDDALDERFLTLAEVLRSQGFETASFVQNPNAGPGAGLHQGFGHVFDKDRAGTRAGELYGGEPSEWIASHREQNLFVYLHLVDPHGPYDPPPPSDRWFREDPPPADNLPHRPYLDPPWLEAVSARGRQSLYDGEVLHNDQELRRLVTRLEELGMLQDTLIVFLSDHGEHMGEHGIWEHRPPGFVQVTHIPLAMLCPGRLPAGVRVSVNVQALDVMPTILELAQVERDGLLMAGESLVPLAQGIEPERWRERIVVSEEVVERKSRDEQPPWGSLHLGPWHLLNSRSFSLGSRWPSAASLRVFDLRSQPEELATARGFAADVLLELRCARFWGSFSRTQHAVWRAITRGRGRAIEYDAAAFERLRQLGYL